MKTVQRKKDLGEVFTPPILVNEMLDQLPIDLWPDLEKTWLDPTCGNGNFLVEVKNRLLQFHTKEHILENMLFGVDIMTDNIEETIIRLYFNCIFHDPTTKEYTIEVGKYRNRIEIIQLKEDVDWFYTKNKSNRDVSELQSICLEKDIPLSFIRPGLVALFRIDGKLVQNFIAADGLKYDYSFGREGINLGIEEQKETKIKVDLGTSELFRRK